MSGSQQTGSRRGLAIGLGVLVAAVVVVIGVTQFGGSSDDNTGAPAPTSVAPAPGSPTASPEPQQPADCPAVQFLLVPGTYETNVQADPSAPAGLLTGVGNPVADTFEADQVSEYWVPYPAQFGNPMPYPQSLTLGEQALNEELSATAARCPLTKFALSGYSQGAAVAGNVASAIGNGAGPVPAESVVGVALVSDPYRQPGQATMPGPELTGTGVGGPRPQDFGALADRTATVCREGDLICDVPPDALAPQNLGATIASIQSYMTSGVHASYGSFVVDDQGTTATQYLANYLEERIAPVVES